MGDLEFTLLRRRIAHLYNLRLNSYKPGQMRRRLASFIESSGAANVATFTPQLESDPAPRDALRDVITINVTEFFRDEPQWQYFENGDPARCLGALPRPRIWSAGCAIGAGPERWRCSWLR